MPRPPQQSEAAHLLAEVQEPAAAVHQHRLPKVREALPSEGEPGGQVPGGLVAHDAHPADRPKRHAAVLVGIDRHQHQVFTDVDGREVDGVVRAERQELLRLGAAVAWKAEKRGAGTRIGICGRLCPGDAARALLKLMPADVETLKRLKTICQELIKNPVAQPMHGLDSLFFSQSPSETCYNLVVCYSLLMPGTGECYSSREAFTRAI